MNDKLQITKFFVKRSKWLRGEGFEKSKLLREKDNKMCCLGFLSLACGLHKEEILEVGSPYELDSEFFPQKLFVNLGQQELCTQIMDINDHPDPEFLESQREDYLKNLFAVADIAIEFKD